MIVRHQSSSSSSSKSSDKNEEISQHFEEEDIEEEKYDSDQDKGYSQLNEESEREKSENNFDPKNRVLTFKELMALENERKSIDTSQQESFIEEKKENQS